LPRPVGTSWLPPALSECVSRQQARSLRGSTPIHPDSERSGDAYPSAEILRRSFGAPACSAGEGLPLRSPDREHGDALRCRGERQVVSVFVQVVAGRGFEPLTFRL